MWRLSAILLLVHTVSSSFINNSSSSFNTFLTQPCTQTYGSQLHIDSLNVTYAISTNSILSLFQNPPHSLFACTANQSCIYYQVLIIAYGNYRNAFGGFPEDLADKALQLGFDAAILTLGGDDSNAAFWSGRLWRRNVCPIPLFMSSISRAVDSAQNINLTADTNTEIYSFMAGPLYLICLTIPWAVLCSALIILSLSRLIEKIKKQIHPQAQIILALNFIQGCIGGKAKLFPHNLTFRTGIYCLAFQSDTFMYFSWPLVNSLYFALPMIDGLVLFALALEFDTAVVYVKTQEKKRCRVNVIVALFIMVAFLSVFVTGIIMINIGSPSIRTWMIATGISQILYRSFGMMYFLWASYHIIRIPHTDQNSIRVEKYYEMIRRIGVNIVVNFGMIACPVVITYNPWYSSNHGWLSLPYTGMIINLSGLITSWALPSEPMNHLKEHRLDNRTNFFVVTGHSQQLANKSERLNSSFVLKAGTVSSSEIQQTLLK
jgi:hypothetical protein